MSQHGFDVTGYVKNLPGGGGSSWSAEGEADRSQGPSLAGRGPADGPIASSESRAEPTNRVRFFVILLFGIKLLFFLSKCDP